MEEETTQSLPLPDDGSINSLTDKENNVEPQVVFEKEQPFVVTSVKTSEMTNKTIDQISSKIEEVFSKLQRNLEHNTRVFQEKSQSLLSKIDLAEEQISKVLLQLENVSVPAFKKTKANAADEPVESTTAAVVATESIALSGDETKLEDADATTEN